MSVGLLPGEGGSTEFRVAPERRAPVRPAIVGLGAIALVFVAGATAIEWSAWGKREASQAGTRALDLVPAKAGFLRVVASPWAEVSIDGQRIDVTPFARPIPLAAGTHYVTLTHPSAPLEKRQIAINPGETTFIDVTMHVRGAEETHARDGGT